MLLLIIVVVVIVFFSFIIPFEMNKNSIRSNRKTHEYPGLNTGYDDDNMNGIEISLLVFFLFVVSFHIVGSNQTKQQKKIT